MIGNARLQGRRHPQSLVPTDEIVVDEVQGYRVLVILMRVVGAGLRPEEYS